MNIFIPDTFHDFLGEAWLAESRVWGREWRFSVSNENLKRYGDVLRDTIYHHHSSFMLYDDIDSLGFTLSAEALRNRHSGNPDYHNTRMGNFGEVLGAEFIRAFLGYGSSLVFPKRLNPNVDQSMKGIDVLGFRSQNMPAGILIGEAKAGKEFSKDAIEDAYKELSRRETNDLPKMLHFAREYSIHQQDREGTANIERHMQNNLPKEYLLLAITESKPQHPFDRIPQYQKKYENIELLAVHIEIKGLTASFSELFQ